MACGLGLAGSLLVAADGLASGGGAGSVHGPLASEVQENVRSGHREREVRPLG